MSDLSPARRLELRNGRCTYCGDHATCFDHVPPRSRRQLLATSDLPFVEVPACTECNQALHAKNLLTVEDRKDYMKERIAKQYATYLRKKRWTEDDAEDLAAMGYGLRTVIESFEATSEWVRARLAW